MSPEDRSDISNAIWLCATHADLIDRDEKKYSADELRRMKREHETNCGKRQRNPNLAGESFPDLIAIGPDVVFTGEFLGADDAGWSLRLRNFPCALRGSSGTNSIVFGTLNPARRSRQNSRSSPSVTWAPSEITTLATTACWRLA